MKRRIPSLSLSAWFLGVLLPATGLMVIVYAIHLYLRLNATIIGGFDQKLVGISTATAAFVDPEDHKRLTEPLPITSISHVPLEKAIMALDVKRRALLRISTTDGLAADTGIHVPTGVSEISSGLRPTDILLVDAETGSFTLLDTATGKAKPAFSVTPPILSVCTWVEQGTVFIAGRDLRRYDMDQRKLIEIAPAVEPVRDMTYNNRMNTLVALSEKGTELLWINPLTGAVTRRQRLTSSVAGADGRSTRVAAELKTVGFEPVSGDLFGTGSSFVSVDDATGLVSSKGFLPSFGQERGPIYARYAEPMHRIIVRTHLTYLYTQIVQSRNNITYGIDGTVGENHSPLMSTDILPDEEVPGVQHLMTENSYYTSDIQKWQQWGLIKSAFAPIIDDTGRAIAMVGADVDVSTIQYQTRRALVIAFGFGTGMLLLGGLFTFEVARKLTAPLVEIRTAALHAASRNFSYKVEVSRPRELRELAAQFSTVSSGLGRQLDQLSKAVSTQRIMLERNALVDWLGHVDPLVQTGTLGETWAWGPIGPVSTEGALMGGAVRKGDQVLVWISATILEPLAAAARRGVVSVAAEALLGRHSGDPDALARTLEPLFADSVAAWILVTPEGCRAILRKVMVFTRAGDGLFSKVEIDSFRTLIAPVPGGAVVLMGPVVPGYASRYLDAADRSLSTLAFIGAAGRDMPTNAVAAFAVAGILPPERS